MLNKIATSLNGEIQYMVLVVIASIVAIALTFVINMTNKRLRFMKYIPGLFLMVLGMSSLIIVLPALFERDSLNNIFISVISLTAGVCSLLFALCIGIYNKDKHPRAYLNRKARKRKKTS